MVDSGRGLRGLMDRGEGGGGFGLLALVGDSSESSLILRVSHSRALDHGCS